jgi:hypothetical protein
LLEMLGRIPLAISQSAVYMKRNRMALKKYVEFLKKSEGNFKEFLNAEIQDHRRKYNILNSVFLTWRISFDLIREQELRAAELLSLIAMFDRQRIPE